MSGATGGGIGGSPAGNASTTFVSPSTPTTGLQRYNLDRRIKNLNPSSLDRWRKKYRALTGRRDQGARGSARKSANSDTLQKDLTMFIDTINGMVGTLSQSVAGIFAAGGDNTAEQLKKSFDEFAGALKAEIEGDLAKRAPVEEPLFKGLGTIGRVADMLGHISKKIEAIAAGYDNEWQMNQTGPNGTAASDPASDDVVSLLQSGMHMVELALRTAVNEHVQVADDADMAPGATLPPGVHLIMVPDGDDPSTGAVVKTTLPEDLAKMATDPAVLQDEVIEAGLGLLTLGGIPEDGLEKMLGVFDGEDVLGKAFPPKKNPDGSADAGGAPDPDPNPSPVPATDGTGTGEGDGQTDPTGAGGDPGGAGGDDQNPLEVAQRMLAGAMVVLHDFEQAIMGADDGSGAGDPGMQSDPTMAPPGMGKRAPRTLSFAAPHLAAPAAAVAPSPEVLELRKMVQDMSAASTKQNEAIDLLTKGMTTILGLPQPAKGVTNVLGGLDLTKQADGAPVPSNTYEVMAALNKMAPEDKALALIKISQQMPEPRFRAAP